MLVLTRKIGESIMIGDNIVITILGVKGAQTKIGIDADRSIPVHREEIYARIQNENEDEDEIFIIKHPGKNKNKK